MINSILIVDDSDTARMFVQRCLEAIGFAEAEFTTATDGKEAITSLKENPVDLVISDLTMPNMDGEQLLKRIKSSPKLCDIPVAIISSAGNPAKEIELSNMGAVGVLAKPFSPAELYQLLLPFMETQ